MCYGSIQQLKMQQLKGRPERSSKSITMTFLKIIQSDHFVLSTNFLFKFNVSLPLVTGELLQNTVDVNNVTYKLYNIKLQRLPVLLNTKNYLSTGQAIT